MFRVPVRPWPPASSATTFPPVLLNPATSAWTTTIRYMSKVPAADEDLFSVSDPPSSVSADDPRVRVRPPHHCRYLLGHPFVRSGLPRQCSQSLPGPVSGQHLQIPTLLRQGIWKEQRANPWLHPHFHHFCGLHYHWSVQPPSTRLLLNAFVFVPNLHSVFSL